MPEKKYFTKPDLGKRNFFFKDIENLNKFSKINIHNLTDAEIKEFIGDYPHLLLRDITKSPFLDYTKISLRYIEMMKTEPGLQKIRSSLSSVQNALLEKISEVRCSLKNSELNQLLSFSGTITITYNSGTNQFIEIYMPENFDPDAKFNTDMECKIIRVKYFESIAYLCQELPADRFKICGKCDTPFFQATAREKLFCSDKCSKAVAQASYMKRKTQGGDDK